MKASTGCCATNYSTATFYCPAEAKVLIEARRRDRDSGEGQRR